MTVEDVTISLDTVALKGILELPTTPQGIVLFVHGSGSSRLSPRNQFVAHYLAKHQIGTLLFDLLTQEEEAVDDVTRELRFDIQMLADRLVKVTEWLSHQKAVNSLPIGYFGASTGAAAALIAASDTADLVGAVVSRGGRPDLARDALPQVHVPTLLIVGGNDFGVIELNQEAYAKLNCTKELAIVPNATHLFEESGTLEQVAKLAANWFIKYLKAE